MKIIKLQKKVLSELDSRDLSNPSTRENALERVLTFVRQSQYFKNEEIILPKNKKTLKENYQSYKGKLLTGSENSIINEIYNQYEL